MGKEKQYTFEDWKKGQIYRDYDNREIENFSYNKVQDIGWVPQELYEQGFMEVEDFRKITEAQKKTFYRAVEISVKSRVNVLKRNLSNAPEPDKLLSNRIESLESFIDQNTSFLKGLLYAGEWNRSGINYARFMQINDPNLPKYEGKLEINLTAFRIVTNDNGYPELRPPHPSQDKPHNPLYDLTVRHETLKELKKIKSEREAKSSKDKNSLNNEASKKSELTRREIFQKAQQLKKNGMTVEDMFDKIESWLLEELNFTKKEIKKRFNFSLKDPHNFNRVVNKNASLHN